MLSCPTFSAKRPLLVDFFSLTSLEQSIQSSPDSSQTKSILVSFSQVESISVSLVSSNFIRDQRTWAIAVKKGSYQSLFLPNSGLLSLEKKEIIF